MITKAGVMETDAGAVAYLLDGDLRIQAPSREKAIAALIQELKARGVRGQMTVSNGPHFVSGFKSGDCRGLS